MKTLIATAFLLTAMHLNAQGDSIVLKFQASSLSNDSISITTFKAYITEIALKFDDGTTYSEPESYHLIDFTDEKSGIIVLPVPQEKSLAELSYSLGTDSLTNVSGVYDGDLDPIHGMYWAWNSGYINIKIEGTKNGNDFAYHIGGYAAPYATLVPITHGFNNWPTEELIIEFDLMKFVNAPETTLIQKVMSPGEKARKLSEIAGTIIAIGE